MGKKAFEFEGDSATIPIYWRDERDEPIAHISRLDTPDDAWWLSPVGQESGRIFLLSFDAARQEQRIRLEAAGYDLAGSARVSKDQYEYKDVHRMTLAELNEEGQDGWMALGLEWIPAVPRSLFRGERLIPYNKIDVELKQGWSGLLMRKIEV